MNRFSAIRRLLSFFFCFVFFSSTINFANAFDTRASNFIDHCYAEIQSTSRGNISISYFISGVGKMDEIGAFAIYVYEDEGNGFRRVEEFFSSDPEFSYMISNNTMVCSEEVSYNGTIGNRYYAQVFFLASNDLGEDTDSFTTTIITAT